MSHGLLSRRWRFYCRTGQRGPPERRQATGEQVEGTDLCGPESPVPQGLPDGPGGSQRQTRDTQVSHWDEEAHRNDHEGMEGYGPPSLLPSPPVSSLALPASGHGRTMMPAPELAPFRRSLRCQSSPRCPPTQCKAALGAEPVSLSLCLRRRSSRTLSRSWTGMEPGKAQGLSPMQATTHCLKNRSLWRRSCLTAPGHATGHQNLANQG